MIKLANGDYGFSTDKGLSATRTPGFLKSLHPPTLSSSDEDADSDDDDEIIDLTKEVEWYEVSDDEPDWRMRCGCACPYVWVGSKKGPSCFEE